MATKLKEVRTSKFMTQLDLAQAVGVTENAVRQWELGNSKPFPRHQKKLVEMFQMDINILLQPAVNVA